MRKLKAGTIVAAVLAGLPGAFPRTGISAPAHTLVVTAYEYTFQAPDSVAAGVVTVRLVDRGKISHQVSLARLDDSSSLTRVMQMLVENKVHTGGVRWIGGVETAIAGGSAETMLALQPGRYVIVCAYDGGSGTTHMTMGMIRPLVVTAGAAKPYMSLPPTATTIRLSDYHVAVVGSLHSGRQLVRVENLGTHRHHLNLTRIVGHATLDEIMSWDGKSQPAPLEDMSGGAAAMEPGESSVIALELTPGRYELACVMSDGPQGKPHYMLGMHDEIAVR